MNGLIIMEEPLEMILDGKKSWEIRGSRTTIEGPIALIRSGSGKIFGVCDLVGCVGPLTSKQFRQNARKAGLKPSEASLGYYKKTYAWVLAKPRPLKTPVPYKHPLGAVIWVKLDTKTLQILNRSRKTSHRPE